MKKIEINLYPYKLRSDKKLFEFIARSLPIILVATIGIVSLNLIVFAAMVISQVYTKNLNYEWQRISPEARQLDSLKKEVASLKERQSQLQGLVTPALEVDRACADIFRALPDTMWFDTIKLSNKSLNFIGYAVKVKEDYLVSVDMFIQSLKEADYFSKAFNSINLKSSRKAQVYGREVVVFEIECKSLN